MRARAPVARTATGAVVAIIGSAAHGRLDPSALAGLSPEQADAVRLAFAAAFLDGFKLALVVGGWVRDRIMGRASSNIDLEVFGIPQDRLASLLQQFGRVEGWFDEDKPRKLSAKQVGEKVVKAMPKKPGIKLHFGRENEAEREKSRDVFVFRLEGDDAQILDDVAARLEPMIQRVDGVLGIRSGEDPSPSEMALVVDRDRANASSVNPEVIAGLVGYALRGSSLPKYNHEGREIPVRAVQSRSERLKDAVDRAYLEKYRTPGSIRYARDLGRAKSRATTTEPVPISRRGSGRGSAAG